MKEMTDKEYEEKMEGIKKHLERINHGKPVTFLPSVNPSDPEEFFCDDDPFEPKDRSNIISPGCSGYPIPPSVFRARASVVEMLKREGMMSFMPEFNDLFDQIEKIIRRKK